MALSRQRKRRLHRRAVTQVNRETAGAGASARAAIGSANREYGRTVADVRGADRVARSQLQHLLGRVQGSGLKGRYAAQLANSLRRSIAESASGVSYGISQAAQDRTDAIADARADLASARADRQADVGKRYNSLLDEARDAKADRLKDQKGGDRGVKNALLIAQVAFKNSSAKDRKTFLSDPGAFAAGVAKKAEGADPVDARKAVAILFKRIRKDMLQDTFENVYGPQDWDKKKRSSRGR